MTGGGKVSARSTRPKTTGRALRKLIEEAVVDCYTEEEQQGGFLVMFQDRVTCPFRALVVGEEVEVRGFDWDGAPQGIVAICKRKGRTFRVNVTALEWAARPPVGASAVWARNILHLDHKDMIARSEPTSYVGPAGTEARGVPEVRVLHVLAELRIISAAGYKNLPNHVASCAAHSSSDIRQLSFCFSALPWWGANTPSNWSRPTTSPGPTPISSANS